MYVIYPSISSIIRLLSLHPRFIHPLNPLVRHGSAPQIEVLVVLYGVRSVLVCANVVLCGVVFVSVYVVFVEWSFLPSLLQSSCCGLVHRMSKSTGNVALESSNGNSNSNSNSSNSVSSTCQCHLNV